MPSRICIVGGGPSGLATAIALAQAGFRTTVIDRATPPIDKACGEGLLPDSLASLGKLGIQIPSHCGHPFRGIRFSDGQSAVASSFPNGPAVGLRRTALHTLLVNRATALGVNLQWGSRQTTSNDADLLVGADGGHSTVRREAGLESCRHESYRYGFRQHFQMAPWSDTMEVHWGRRSQLYVTPISPTEIGVAVVSKDPKLRIQNSWADFPEVAERLQHAAPTTSERGSLSTMRRLSAVHAGRVALVGDASGSVDVITGEGIGLGFQHALALARSLQAGSLDLYGKEHRRIGRRPRLMAQLLLTLSGNPNLRGPAFAGLAFCPSIFSALLAFHVGA